MSLGKNISKARKRAGLSQTSLGELCGWEDSPQSRVSNYENDRREPTLTDLRDIARACNTTLLTLLEGQDNSLAGRLANSLEKVDPKHHDKVFKALHLIVEALQDN